MRNDTSEIRIPFVSADITVRGRLADGRLAQLRISQLKFSDPDDFRFRDRVETEDITGRPGDVVSYARYEYHTLMLELEGQPIAADGRPPHFYTFEILPDEEDR